ncbi:hypothetical protein NKG94_08445 [Micromonospora sp. M12]
MTGNHPLSAVFSRNGARTYVASNPTATPITVTFSSGTTLAVGAGKTATTGAYTWSGGNAAGGVPPTTPTDPHRRPTRRRPRVARRGTCCPGVAGAAGSAATTTVAAANGNHDGTPTNAQVFTATGLNLAYAGGQTAFDLFVDAGTAVGNGVQVRVSYDLTGNGSWDRVETGRYFATDPVSGYEHYTQSAGLSSATGTLGALSNGTVRVEVWSAIGNNPTTVGIGNQSVLRLPYS